jgi:hypothetical protein
MEFWSQLLHPSKWGGGGMLLTPNPLKTDMSGNLNDLLSPVASLLTVNVH